MTTRNVLSKFMSEYWPAAVLTAGLLALSVYLQTAVYWSPMVLPDDVWLAKVNVHLTEHPFNIRFFQTYATLGVHHLFGLPIRESFFSVQFLLTMLLGPLFFRYLRRLEFDRIWANIGVVLLMTAYPILGAHFAPTHTWDDFWTYVFLVLALINLLDQRWIVSAIFLTLGALAREQVVLYYPILLLMAWWYRRDAPRGQVFAALILPVVVLGAYRYFLDVPIDNRAWEMWAANIANAKTINDCVVSLIISFGFMWPTALAGLVLIRRSKRLTSERFLFWGAILTVPVTAVVTLLFTFARETRIFFPPFVFVIPLSLIALQSAWAYVRERWSMPKMIGALVWVAAMAGIGIAISGILFPEFDYKANSEFRRPLAGAHLGLMAALTLAYAGSHLNREADIYS